MREGGQNFETLQRQQRTVDHKPAQMLKVRYREKATGHDWIEELVFIEGPDEEIYSVALKCAPENLARLEPVLERMCEQLEAASQESPLPSRSRSDRASARTATNACAQLSRTDTNSLKRIRPLPR